MVYQYKCPDCGADMSFDASTGMLHCESCGRTDHVDSHGKSSDAAAEESIHDYETFQDQTQYTTFENEEAVQYQCNNCGAVLLTSADTTATTCSFCGAPMILGDRLSGKLAPSYVIPFQITKQQATDAFKKWCKNGRLTPKGFMSADRIKSLTGIYVPFWLYDLTGQGDTHADCTISTVYEEGDYTVTKTNHYDVYRKVEVQYEKVPCDASEKMDDTFMDRLEPYDYTNLKQFQAPYLAGFLAEKYNYTDTDLFPRITTRTTPFVEDYLRETISGYDTVTLHHENINIQKKKAVYTLLPVWMICYDYDRAEHTFAMNGQTGKVVGTPPLSKGKIAAYFGGITLVLFVLLRIITILLGGDIL